MVAGGGDMLGLGLQIRKHGWTIRATVGVAVGGFLHVQSCIKLSQTAALGGKLGFLREGLAQLRPGCGLLIVEIRQLFDGLSPPVRDTGEGVVQTEQITSGIRSQGYTVAHGTL